MSELVPLIQISTPIKPNEIPQVVIRVSDERDVEAVLGMINDLTHRVVPLANALQSALDNEGATGVAALASGGMNPQPVPPQQQYNQGQQQQQQGYQPQQQAPQQQAYQQAATTRGGWQGEVGDCWVGTATGGNRNHSRNCPDCQGATVHTVTQARGRDVNAHICATDPNHKRVWCDSPIWNSKRVKAEGQGIPVNPDLLYG